MTPDQLKLTQLMSDLSEDFMCAGWLIDLEFDLWKDLNAEGSPSHFWSEGWNGELSDYRARLDEIGELAARCGGWIVWHTDDNDPENSGNRFVTWEEWGKILGLSKPAEPPERFARLATMAKDPRWALLAPLTRQQLVDLVMGINLCESHLKRKLSGGTYGGCLHCGAIEHSGALARIDVLIDEAAGRGNDMQVSTYDLACDPDGVVQRLEEFLKKR